jgi:hypothetical protein
MYSMYGRRTLIQSFSSWYEGDSSKSRDLSNALTHLLTVYDLCKSVQCALCIVQKYMYMANVQYSWYFAANYFFLKYTVANCLNTIPFWLNQWNKREAEQLGNVVLNDLVIWLLYLLFPNKMFVRS